MKAGFLDGKLSTKQVINDAVNIFHRARWISGVIVCPHCGEVHKIYQAKDGSYRYKCGNCNRKFTDTTNTLLHGSKLSIEKWMQGIYEMFTDNFISSPTLAIKLHINQKSAWLMQTKIRYAMEQKNYILSGIIAQDEMYIGGSLENYHYSRKLDLLRDRHLIGDTDRRYSRSAIMSLNADLKQPVFGMNDGKQIVLQATPNPIKKQYIQQIFNEHSESGSIVVSDESELYNGWFNATGSTIYTNNHHNNQYLTKEGYTSNRIENTFSWYKRGFIRLTHCKYHQLFLNEFVFRYNTRNLKHTDRFTQALTFSIGRVITYKDIKAYNSNNAYKK